jgi:hypothetical protein
MDAIKERIAVKKTIVARSEKAPERNGPKIRFMIFSAHRLMRNGTVECVRYYDRESPVREFIVAVRKRQLSSGAELTLMLQARENIIVSFRAALARMDSLLVRMRERGLESHMSGARGSGIL